MGQRKEFVDQCWVYNFFRKGHISLILVKKWSSKLKIYKKLRKIKSNNQTLKLLKEEQKYNFSLVEKFQSMNGGIYKSLIKRSMIKYLKIHKLKNLILNKYWISKILKIPLFFKKSGMKLRNSKNTTSLFIWQKMKGKNWKEKEKNKNCFRKMTWLN